MSFQRFLLSFIFLIVLTRSSHLASAYCIDTNGNYTSNSNYKANLDAVLSNISTKVNSSSGFYSASAGQTPDTVNAIVLCRIDAPIDTCRSCIKNLTADMLQWCPNQKQAIVWYEFCMVRYSDETIFGTLATYPRYYWLSPLNVTSPDKYKDGLRTALNSLRYQAANGGSLRKIAVGNVSGPDSQIIYALVQCTPDLSAEDCNSCLIGAAGDLSSCCSGSEAARMAYPSCTIHYETNNHFYKETRLQELQRLPPPPSPPPPLPPPPPPPPGKTIRTAVIIGCSIAVFLLMILVASAGYCFRRKKGHKSKEELLNEIATVKSLDYDFNTIKAATNDFSDNNKLGQGGFGAVYKGKLPNDREIAVKTLSTNSGQGDREFKSEVVFLAKLQHKNLVKLLGFSIQGNEKLIIYEFLHNGSLNGFIFDPIKRLRLDWGRRYKIIEGIARGMQYLHEDSTLTIIHRDLKTDNILLDGDMNPKIADFGLARLLEQDESKVNTSKIVGTLGYIAPEYAMHGQFSFKSDVFSFGVIILEIISGQRTKCIKNGENVDLVSCTWKNWQEGTAENMIDPVLREDGTYFFQKDVILRCIHIGLLCAEENIDNRPTMRKIIRMLQNPSMTLPIPSDPALAMANRFGPNISIL